MRYLIDTNVFINMIEDDLSKDVLAIIMDYDNMIYKTLFSLGFKGNTR